MGFSLRRCSRNLLVRVYRNGFYDADSGLGVEISANSNPVDRGSYDADRNLFGAAMIKTFKGLLRLAFNPPTLNETTLKGYVQLITWTFFSYSLTSLLAIPIYLLFLFLGTPKDWMPFIVVCEIMAYGLIVIYLKTKEGQKAQGMKSKPPVPKRPLPPDYVGADRKWVNTGLPIVTGIVVCAVAINTEGFDWQIILGGILGTLAGIWLLSAPPKLGSQFLGRMFRFGIVLLVVIAMVLVQEGVTETLKNFGVISQ